MTEQRSHFRFPVKRLALLNHAGNSILCDVLDLTEQEAATLDRIPDRRRRYHSA